MNMFKKNDGFTLVELIVVIAILAILAGVSVPAYSGYISKANDAAVLSELTAIHTAAQSACALNGTFVEKIEVTSTGATVTPDNDTVATQVKKDFGELYTASANLDDLISKHSSELDTFTWTDGEWNILADDSNNNPTDNSTEGN